MSYQHKIKKMLPILIAIIVAGGIGFFGGMAYGKGMASQSGRFNFQNGLPGQGAGAGRRGGFGAGAGGIVAGEILSKDAMSITVQLRTGGSKIVLISGSTAVMKAVSGSTDDLTVGEQVTAIGTANSDGSITAQSVQVRQASSRMGAN